MTFQVSIFIDKILFVMVEFDWQLEVHSVERIYFRQRCSDASNPRVVASTGAQYQYVAFSRSIG